MERGLQSDSAKQPWLEGGDQQDDHQNDDESYDEFAHHRDCARQGSSRLTMDPQLKAVLVALIFKSGGNVIVTPEDIGRATKAYGGLDGIDLEVRTIPNKATNAPLAVQVLLMPARRPR